MNLEILIAFMVILISLYGLTFSKSMVKSIIFLNIIQSSVILLFVFMSRVTGKGLPILGSSAAKPIDPLPQALMITAIVIGAATTSLVLMLSIKIFHFYGSLKWKDVFERKD